jgi:hypothetical protein
VRLAYFQANRLKTELYKQETEILRRKDESKLKIKQTSIATVRNHLRTLAGKMANVGYRSWVMVMNFLFYILVLGNVLHPQKFVHCFGMTWTD